MTTRRVRVSSVQDIRPLPWHGRVEVVLNGETSTGAETRVTLLLDHIDVGVIRRTLGDAAVQMGNAWHEAAR